MFMLHVNIVTFTSLLESYDIDAKYNVIKPFNSYHKYLFRTLYLTAPRQEAY